MIRSRGRRESEVQAAVVAYLSFRTDFFWWRNNISAGRAPSGNFMKSGGISGAPDLQGIQYPGRFVGIELKREKGGESSEDQLRWAANCRSHGGLYILATSVKDVEVGLGPQLTKIHILKKQKVYAKGPKDLCSCTANWTCPLCSRVA